MLIGGVEEVEVICADTSKGIPPDLLFDGIGDLKGRGGHFFSLLFRLYKPFTLI